MSTVTVSQAEQQLATVRAEAQKLERENAKQKIQELSREGAALVKKLYPLTAEVKDLQDARLTLSAKLVRARDQIASFSQPLHPLTFPSSEDIVTHERQLAWWRGEQKRLVAKHLEVYASEVDARRRAMAMNNRLIQITFEIQNLTAVAEGRMPGQPAEGGLFRVSENFLGHTDRRFD